MERRFTLETEFDSILRFVLKQIKVSIDRFYSLKSD